jgi:hypothetical protein
MNPGPNPHEIPSVNRASGAAVGFIFGSLVFIVLVVIVRFSATVPTIDANRGAALSSALSEIRSNEVVSLESPGWIDRSRGIVRLPIQKAMQLTEFYWQQPAAGRNELIMRSQKATAPAPKPAATPNQFE